MTNPIALTAGEPAGIGPDLCVMLAQQKRSLNVVVIADKSLISQRAEALNLPLIIQDFNTEDLEVTKQSGQLCVLHVPVSKPVFLGSLDPANARYVLSTLDIAIEGCLAQTFSGMVTAPLHKGVINDAGIAFTGHTEYLAEKTNSDPVMMLAADTPNGMLRVALATTHLSLAEVPKALTQESLTRSITVLHNELVRRFNIQHPQILVSGLNPHAGEGGHLGKEEIDTIEPVLTRLRKQSYHLVGPLPADTLFTPQHLNQADAVLAMFHDQGLPVLKYAGFGNAINITLGLPIIRTSVDHGTALDKAGTGDINSGSLLAALDLAGHLTKNNG